MNGKCVVDVILFQGAVVREPLEPQETAYFVPHESHS